jgi:hypothetical protein
MGIGNNNPSYSLDVTGDSRHTGNSFVDDRLQVGNITSLSDSFKLQVKGATTIYEGPSGSNYDGITISGAFNGLKQIFTNYNGTGAEQDLAIGTFTNRANQVYLDANGNVGINTSSPSQRLHVNGNSLIGVPSTDNQLGQLQLETSYLPSFVIRSQTGNKNVFQFTVDDDNDRNVIWSRTGSGTTHDICFSFGSIDNCAMLIDSSTENIGIGTNSPISPLDIERSTGNSTIRLGSNAEAQILSRNAGGGSGHRNLNTFSNDFGINTANSDGASATSRRLTVKHSTGNVGIGTDNPLIDLQLNDYAGS